MGGLAGQQELAFEIPIEGDAVTQQILDARRSLGHHHPGHRLIDDAGTGGQRIGHMLVHRIARAHCGGDAALRPGRGRPLPDRAAASTVTGRGASFSAQNNPANPPPTMRISSTPLEDGSGRVGRHGFLSFSQRAENRQND